MNDAVKFQTNLTLDKILKEKLRVQILLKRKVK